MLITGVSIMPLISKKLQSYYDGVVLANETAMNDPTIVNVLDDLNRREFTFHSTTGIQTWNISDRH